MKGKKRGIIAMVLLMVLSLVLLVGCGGEPNAERDAGKTAELSAAEKKTIIDQDGREVEIPTELNRVVTGRILPFPAVYYLATGSCKELVGIHPASKSAAENSMLKVLAPEILNAQTGFVKGKELNVEELLKLNPDLVFVLGETGMNENLEKVADTGIPTIGIKTMSLYNGDSVETLNSWLELLGQITGKKERADEIINYGRETQKMIDSRLESVADEANPRGLMIFRHSDKEIEVSGSGFFGHHWLVSTGAQDAAEEIKIKSKVNMEQIYKWNPDIIYITNFTKTQPEDLLNNTIKGQDWSRVKAVQEGRVYKIPLGIYRWFPPSGDAPLMLKWLAQKNHPEVFADYDMKDEIKSFYSRFYEYDLSNEQAEMILNPVRAAAGGYK